jgi:hypothetical protein
MWAVYWNLPALVADNIEIPYVEKDMKIRQGCK